MCSVNTIRYRLGSRRLARDSAWKNVACQGPRPVYVKRLSVYAIPNVEMGT